MRVGHNKISCTASIGVVTLYTYARAGVMRSELVSINMYVTPKKFELHSNSPWKRTTIAVGRPDNKHNHCGTGEE